MPDLSVDRVLKSASRIRFPTGAFGKTCMLVAILSVACAAIAWSARNEWVAVLALMIVGIVALYAIVRVFNFADSNPAAAILEGAEFVRHEQMQLAAKGSPVFPPEQLVQSDELGQLPSLAILNHTDESDLSENTGNPKGQDE